MGAVIVSATVSEFCSAANHDAVEPSNLQNVCNGGESCWETMVRNYGDLVPPERRSTSPTAVAHEELEWVVTDRTGLMVLAVDMLESDLLRLRLDTLAAAVEFQDRLGSLFRARSGLTDFRAPARLLAPIAESLNDQAMGIALESWSARSQAGGVRGVPADWDPIFEKLPPSANPNLLILASRPAVDHATADALMQALRPHAVRLHCLSLGLPPDPSTVQQMVQRMQGRLEILPDAAAEAHQFRFLCAASELVAAMTGRQVAVAREIALMPSAHELDSDASETWGGRELSPLEFSIAARIEADCASATFIIVAGPEHPCDVALIRPTGERLRLDADSVSEVRTRSTCLRAFVVRTPDAGVWRVRVRRAAAPKAFPVAIHAFVDHWQLAPGFDWKLDRKSGELDLRVTVGAPHPLLGLEPPIARVYREDDFGRPLPQVIVTLALQPNMVGDRRFPSPQQHPNGQFVGTVGLPQPGLYRVEVRAVNRGTAHVPTEEADTATTPRVTEFDRLVHRQVYWERTN